MTSLSTIAASIAPYDGNDMPVDAVRDFLARMITPVTDAEPVDLFAALGRVVAGDVISPVSVPPHDNSAMDGFAFDGAQLRAGEPLLLRCVGTALAGHAWSGVVQPGECVRIMTGAVMPVGLDTVIPIELTTTEHDGGIHIPADAVRTGANRRLKGEDLLQGGVALADGELVTPAALGLLASLGLSKVKVRRRLRVAYFSTGDEILQPGEAPREGAVYDSNRYTLFGLLTRLGMEVVDLGSVRDEPALIEATFREAASRADAILTSGGVSGGDADHTKAMMQRLGDVAFWRIAMRPGRPMAVGWLNRDGGIGASDEQQRCVLFGLPGNPVAAMVTFLAFVRPALLQMMGCTRSEPPRLRAICTEPLRKRAGRTEFQRGIVSRTVDGTLVVRTTGNQGSGMLSSMVHGNGLIVLGHDQTSVQPGDSVDVMMFEGVI
ncbi:molybdopterin molybdotransferase MoeA [Diaphorobacter caeni]|uniref:molybdopterin molybdotransferase MoeA n=1 Tax=Diaphorobacter caeni TaxID=2784387 RepID=UPI00188F5786|nr:gephyrin-like molybdotransferase Glp [Diaphorobacter caeni]MBF5005966.1 molybdopterin molybdotransferase MoeA [Diaphorobacter caeni]